MKIYIDSDYRCHTTETDNTWREFDVPFFDGKCAAFIEGYRFVPKGESYTWDDGTVFHGKMIAPWKPYGELAAAQGQYEAMLAQMDTAYQEGVISA